MNNSVHTRVQKQENKFNIFLISKFDGLKSQNARRKSKNRAFLSSLVLSAFLFYCDI